MSQLNDTESKADKGIDPATTGSIFADALTRRWYEATPYAEHIPEEWPALMAEFVRKYGECDAEKMYQVITEASASGDPWTELFESIFQRGWEVAISTIADAVYDRDAPILELVDLEPSETDGGFRQK